MTAVPADVATAVATVAMARAAVEGLRDRALDMGVDLVPGWMLDVGYQIRSRVTRARRDAAANLGGNIRVVGRTFEDLPGRWADRPGGERPVDGLQRPLVSILQIGITALPKDCVQLVGSISTLYSTRIVVDVGDRAVCEPFAANPPLSEKGNQPLPVRTGQELPGRCMDEERPPPEATPNHVRRHYAFSSSPAGVGCG